MASLSFDEQQAFNTDLHASAVKAASAAQMRAIYEQDLPPQSVVTLYSNFYKPAGEVGDYISVDVEFPRNQIETATIVMKVTDPLAPLAMTCYQTVVPVTIQVGEMRWSGRVTEYDYAMVRGVKTLTLQCQGDYSWFSKILVWPNFLLPIQTQYPTKALFLGPAITCIKTCIQEQTFRLQSGIWEAVNNLLSGNLDWEAWIGTLLESDGNPIDMLMTPIVVIPTDPLFDTSPWVSFNARMDKVSTVVEQVVKDNGLVLSANLWLPGEPQPEGLLIPLTLPTIVVDVKDRSGRTGPTGTAIDGLILDVVDIQAGVLGDTLAPFLNPDNAYAPEGVNIAPVLGVDFVQPWVLFHDHPRGGLTEFHLYGHHPLAFTVIGGGKSPKWINDLINATFEWFIDAISIAIGITGIPSDLLDGTFDDVLLAFQLIENFERRVKLGPYGWPEYFVQTGASAYTLDEWFALEGAMWDTRGYHAVRLSFDNGFPYTIGKDLFVGCLASFVVDGWMYTEFLEKVTFRDDRKSRAKIDCVIGDGKSHDNPFVKVVRNLTKFQEAFQIITLSQN
jgi:hypothetical protein